MGHDFVEALKQRMGFQAKVVYCRVCDYSSEPDKPIDKPYSLLCRRHSELEVFPVMKTSTCTHGQESIKADESDEESSAEDPGMEWPDGD